MTYYEERDDIKKKLSQLLEMEKKKVEELQRELKTLPDGEIVVKKHGEGFFPYKRLGKKECGITKDRKLCRLLARKRIVHNRISVCTDNCRFLRKMIRIADDVSGKTKRQFHNVTCDRLGNILPEGEYRYSNDVYRWMTASYRKNGFMPENLKYETKSGLWVRSKSERSIADLLTERVTGKQALN